ncbi:MAG: hypothetical protein IPL40_15180 [Proteobacteria bacterium]|nr:hypothetical protein [Pseudomonadota bacterium]
MSDTGTVPAAGAQCGPSTCASGCCDAASGSCVLSTQQTLTGKCGFGGQVCGPCSGTNPQQSTLPAYCAACAPGQPGAQVQCCHAAQQACVPATQVQSTVTGTWCSVPSGSTLPGGQADALSRCQSSCGGCCTDAGLCVELGVGKGQSNQRCGNAAGRCEACQYGEVCDANYGTCNRPEPAFRVCVRQVVVDGSYVDDEWVDAILQGYVPVRTEAHPEFIATLIAGGKTPKLGTRVQAIKHDGVWVSTPMGLDCVSGIKESELLEGLGSGVSILVTEYDRVSAADTVGACSFAVSALDVFGGAAEVWIDSCMPPIRGVLVQIVPENL